MSIDNVSYYSDQIVKYCNDNRIPITNLKLQKILYFLQKEYFKNNDALLFNETFMAFEYGPVMYSEWKKYSKFGKSNLTVLSNTKIKVDTETIKLISKYLRIDVWKLVDLSHEEIPWRENSDYYFSEISNERLVEYWRETYGKI